MTIELSESGESYIVKHEGLICPFGGRDLVEAIVHGFLWIKGFYTI